MAQSSTKSEVQESTEEREEKPQEQPQTGKNALEWTVFALSLLLVSATFGWLAYQGFQGASAPPRLEITLGEPVETGARVLVPVKIENRGDTTATNVEVEVERRGTSETGSFSLPHLPRRGEREGWVAFDAPLRKADLEAEVKGYEEP